MKHKYTETIYKTAMNKYPSNPYTQKGLFTWAYPTSPCVILQLLVWNFS